MAKRIYSFGGGTADGDKSLKHLLGGKGANLAEMSRIGVPVPPGFTITTEVCTEFYEKGRALPSELMGDVEKALSRLEEVVERKLGDSADPLLLSVRSGAPVSMPGMMDTILNLGLNSDTVKGLAEKSGNEFFVWDSYRRLIQMFSDVVLEVSHSKFEKALEEIKKSEGVKLDQEISVEGLKKLVTEYRSIVKDATGKDFPEDPRQQLKLAIEAVFRSWGNPRANAYRKINNIDIALGTAVNIQAMVFGNRGDTSATGVLFSRDPSTGKKGILGEYLVNAQGEDVVAGIRTPGPINELSTSAKSEGVSLEKWRPNLYKELSDLVVKLEKHYRDMQDIEFTIEDERLWLLQTRAGKRTAPAAIKIAVDLVEEKIADKNEVLKHLKPGDLDQLLHPVFDPKAERNVVAQGLPASPGAVFGKIVFTADEAERMAKEGEKVLLVRQETSPEDVHGMHAAQGVLTSRGGMTSHAAVVARGMGKCCVVGCSGIEVDSEKGIMKTSEGKTFSKEDIISLDGSTGEVLEGQVATVDPEIGDDFGRFMTWADEARKLKVRANADTPHDCEVARNFGAEGVGLCRTEHMFFDPERIDIVRQMILAENAEERKPHLEKILKMQKEDFVGILTAMHGLPVNIRLLDPPLHEFLPHGEEELEQLSRRISVPAEKLEKRVESLKEFNPMLGMRGCRLGITFPEIYEMQAHAIMQAACEVSEKRNEEVFPEIMVPLVSHPAEFNFVRKRISEIAESTLKEHPNANVNYMIGTMIELPRAALVAGEIAKEAQFFSFGTNDLTQTTFGLSRDDSARFLPDYVEQGILPKDPFASLDEGGVLELVQLGTERGRKTNANLKVGVCGEHGGDPDSIRHFHEAGLNYVSCSPFRVPIARLSAAQMAIE